MADNLAHNLEYSGFDDTGMGDGQIGRADESKTAGELGQAKHEARTSSADNYNDDNEFGLPSEGMADSYGNSESLRESVFRQKIARARQENVKSKADGAIDKIGEQFGITDASGALTDPTKLAKNVLLRYFPIISIFYWLKDLVQGNVTFNARTLWVLVSNAKIIAIIFAVVFFGLMAAYVSSGTLESMKTLFDAGIDYLFTT